MSIAMHQYVVWLYIPEWSERIGNEQVLYLPVYNLVLMEIS